MTLIDEQIIRMKFKELNDINCNYNLPEDQIEHALELIGEILRYLLKKDGVLK